MASIIDRLFEAVEKQRLSRGTASRETASRGTASRGTASRETASRGTASRGTASRGGYSSWRADNSSPRDRGSYGENQANKSYAGVSLDGIAHGASRSSGSQRGGLRSDFAIPEVHETRKTKTQQVQLKRDAEAAETAARETNLTQLGNKGFSNDLLTVKDPGAKELTTAEFNALPPTAQEAVLMQTKLYDAARADAAAGGKGSNTAAALKELGLNRNTLKAYQNFSGYLSWDEMKNLNLDAKLSTELLPDRDKYINPAYGAMRSATVEKDTYGGTGVAGQNMPGADNPVMTMQDFNARQADLNSGRTDSAATSSKTSQRIAKLTRKNDPKGYSKALSIEPEEIAGMSIDNILLRDARINLTRQAEKNLLKKEAPEQSVINQFTDDKMDMFYMAMKEMMSPGEDVSLNGVLTQDNYEGIAEALEISPVELSRATQEFVNKVNTDPKAAGADIDLSLLPRLDHYINLRTDLWQS